MRRLGVLQFAQAYAAVCGRWRPYAAGRGKYAAKSADAVVVLSFLAIVQRGVGGVGGLDGAVVA